MKRQAYLHDENLLTLLSLHDFIVPEIQREYVWGSQNNSEDVLKPFLQSIKNSAKVDEHCHYAHGLENLHIGFLYSYKPQYIRDASERITDEYLIDGQQRFTTLFLLVFVRAIVENRLIDFNNLIRWEDGNIAFDYKVRQLTHMFIHDFVRHVQNEGEQVLKDIVDGNFPSWLMNDYLSDTTVKNIIGAVRCIQEVFSEKNDLYYDYLLTRIHFWHFKTDVTSQGEELYITMNSRGEELADNEVQKARKIKSADLTTWGPRWEEWQTFFWRNRTQGSTNNFDADKGFNNLLSCIVAMGHYVGIDYSGIQETEIAYNALKFIVDTDWESKLRNIYSKYYTGWIKSFKYTVWDRFNSTNAKWEIEKDSDTIQRENAVLLWPLFYYYFRQNNESNIDDITFIRLMHLCYLNYNSKKTNHAFLKAFIDELCLNNGNNFDLSSIKNNSFLSTENILLSALINNSQTPLELESLLWEAQDKPYFLDGEDVGGDTIIDFVRSIQSNNVDLCKGLKNLIGNYDVLFPQTKGNEILIKRILLHFKDSNNETFWKRTSPYYDRNYETSSWKRIIRNETFIEFYKEISQNHNKVISQYDINSFLRNKVDAFFRSNTNRNFTTSKWSDRRVAILLDTLTDGKLWQIDRYVDLGYHDDINYVGKPFVGNTWIGNRICGKRNQWQKVLFPANWEWKLQRLYPFYKFYF